MDKRDKLAAWILTLGMPLFAVASGTNTVPYEEGFESYWRGFSFAGTNGWVVGSGGSAVVTNTSMNGTFNYFYALETNHDYCLVMSGSVTNLISTPPNTEVWLDMLMPVATQRVYVGSADGTEYFSFWPTNNGWYVRQSYTNAGVRYTNDALSTNVVVEPGNWARVSVDQNYAVTSSAGYSSFRILVNGRALMLNDQRMTYSNATQTIRRGEWRSMQMPNVSAMGAVWIRATNGPAHLEDLVVKTNAPAFSAIDRGRVSITGVDTNAEVMGFRPAVCRVTLDSGPTNRYVYATYEVSGTAVPWQDYVPLSGVIGIPAGATNADIEVVPRKGPPGDREVVITLVSNAYTTVNPPSSAVVRIVNEVAAGTTRQKGPSSRRTGLIISEIMYHPAKRSDGRDGEYVELYNTEPVDEDIGGYRLTGDIAYTFAAGTVLKAGNYVVVAKDMLALENIPDTVGPFTGSLNNGGGVVRLKNDCGAVLLEAEYSGDYPWPAGTSGAGHSLTLARPDYGEGDMRAWSASSEKGGSPGGADSYSAGLYDGLVINEIVAHTDPPLEDSIELFNSTSNSINIGGCWLSDDPDTNKYRIANGTVIGARGFITYTQTNFGFGLSMAGGSIYLVSSNDDRVIDSVKYSAQSNGASLGRYPDGTAGFQTLVARSPGSSNAPALTGQIVINEIMYHPISERDDDEYIELFNRGPTAMNVGYWKFVDGIDYTIPAGTTIASSNYLVVAKNVTNLLAKYSQLNIGNAIGNYSGQLSDKGERVVLAKPDDMGLPLQDYVIQDEVTYSDGWGAWTDGGGSSLELRDSRSDNRLEMNWAGSDETRKATNYWTSVDTNGTLALSGGVNDELQIILEDEGECLVDDVEVLLQGTTSNRIQNGGFEAGTNGWNFNGNHLRSHWETTEGYSGSASVHLMASGMGNQGPNCIESDLSSTLSDSQVGVIKARIRWVAGTRRILLRLRNNGFEAPAALLVPPDLGSPGQRNSACVSNTGPGISEVEYSPVLPGPTSNIVVTARVGDPDGIASVFAKWRNDTDAATVTNFAWMNDNGTNGDLCAGDGLYSVRLAGLAANKTLAFVVEAADGNASPGISRYPPDAPTNECLVMFGQTDLGGTIRSYRFWITEATRAAWAARRDLSDEPNPGTFVYNNFRAVHRSWARYRGSPFIRPMGDPEGVVCSSVIHTCDEEPVLGGNSFNLDVLEGDDTRQRELLAVWMGSRVQLPFFHQRHIRYYVNEYQRTPVFGESQSPNNRDYIQSWFPDDSAGAFHKIDDWFEFSDGSGDLGFSAVNGRLERYEYGGVLRKTRYRWSWRQESPPDCTDDYSDLLRLVDALNLTAGTSAYDAMVSALVDYEEWAQFSAFEHMICNWDTYTYNRGKNASAYKPTLGGWHLIMWDLDHSHFAGGTSDALFSADDPTISGKFLAHPRFLRAYWRGFQNLVDGPMLSGQCNPRMDQKYAWFLTNSISVTSPDSGLKSWIQTRRTYIISQLASVAATFAITNNGGVDFVSPVNPVTLGGTAPVKIKTIRVNGAEYPDSFSSVVNWTMVLGLTNGANTFVLDGYDTLGQFVESRSITVTWNGTTPSPVGAVVINEIMYNSAAPDDDFVELRNLSTNTICLTGLMLEGPDYIVGPGAFIGPTGYVVLAESLPVYAAIHTNPQVVVGEMGKGLDNGGGLLRILAPDGSGGWTVLDEVTYDDDPPWPAAADGVGPSLQLRDASRDNNRAGNWAVDMTTLYTPGRANSVATNLPVFDLVWINEVMPTNTVFPDNAGEYEPWAELYNAGTNDVTLGSGYYLGDSYTNLVKWAFPAGLTITNKTYLLVWADGETSESSNGYLHAGWRMNGASGVVALARVSGGVTALVDYISYAGLGTNRSYGMYPEGTQSSYQVFHYPSPGASNNPSSDLPPVFINEWMASNNSTTNDPADGKKQDWFELYNASNSAVDLGGFQLQDSDLTNRYVIPGGWVIAPYGFMLIWADSEPGQNAPGRDLHVNFKLDAGGDALRLLAPDGELVHGVTFGPQLTDVGEGQWPDGSTHIYQMPIWTPGCSNKLFRITNWTKSNDTATLEWSTQPGKEYYILWSTSMLSSMWSALATNQALSDRLSTNLPAGSWTNRFYKIRQVK